MYMSADPDSYVGYVDYGERIFASKEELDHISQFGAAADSLVQEMLLGKISPEDCAAKLGAFYSWSQDSEWVKERFNK